MNIIGIIPARFGSKRFPGKPLYVIDGMTLLQRVYQQAIQSKLLSKTYIATDDINIYEHAKTFTDNVVMSKYSHDSGTSRCLEAFEYINSHNKYDGFINIQGDEPFISPDLIDNIAISIAPNYILTAIIETNDNEGLKSLDTVKVVCNKVGEALYFSRIPIPYGATQYFKHIGIYGIHRTFIDKIKQRNENFLMSENLEQLHWLYNGLVIKTILTTSESHGVDTPRDIEKILQMLNVNNV